MHLSLLIIWGGGEGNHRIKQVWIMTQNSVKDFLKLPQEKVFEKMMKISWFRGVIVLYLRSPNAHLGDVAFIPEDFCTCEYEILFLKLRLHKNAGYKLVRISFLQRKNNTSIIWKSVKLHISRKREK